MPRSKRSKVIHTSVVQKKAPKENSRRLFELVQEASEKYQHLFTFSVENMRNNYLKDVRQHFSDSRIFFGKTKVMAKALGTTPEDEHLPGLAKMKKFFEGSIGLLCTNREPSEVLQYFQDFAVVDFARAGAEASKTVVVPEGVVYSRAGELAEEDDVPLPHSLEVTVRKWGMPTRLDKGKVKLDVPYTICEEGKVLNSHQTALLKLFGIATAEFSVKVLAYWSAASQEVTVVDEDGAAMVTE